MHASISIGKRAHTKDSTAAHVGVATRARVWLCPQEAFAVAERASGAAKAERGAGLAGALANRTPRHLNRRWREHGAHLRRKKQSGAKPTILEGTKRAFGVGPSEHSTSVVTA